MKKAIILMNMGGASHLSEIEIFLKNMFNDPRIIGTPNFIRKPLANLITKKRLPTAIKNYQTIGGMSPLLNITKNLAVKIEKDINDAYIDIIMRYTPPFAQEVLKKLQKQNVQKLYLIPMYPHFSTTTTASSIEDIRKNTKMLGYYPKIVSLLHYYNDISYLQIVEDQIIKTLNGDNPGEFNLIFSAHGLPVSIIKKGDPYQKQLQEEVKLHEQRFEKRGIAFNSINLAYQSKVGPMKWLTPSLETILGHIKNKKAIIYPISFTIDNSETIFELDIEYKGVAKSLNFKDYRVCSCPNDSIDFAHLLETLYKKLE